MTLTTTSLSGDLHKALLQVAPIVGVSIGDVNDRATWRVDFDDSASTQQRERAQNALNAYVVPNKFTNANGFLYR